MKCDPASPVQTDYCVQRLIRKIRHSGLQYSQTGFYIYGKLTRCNSVYYCAHVKCICIHRPLKKMYGTTCVSTAVHGDVMRKAWISLRCVTDCSGIETFFRCYYKFLSTDLLIDNMKTWWYFVFIQQKPTCVIPYIVIYTAHTINTVSFYLVKENWLRSFWTEVISLSRLRTTQICVLLSRKLKVSF